MLEHRERLCLSYTMLYLLFSKAYRVLGCLYSLTLVSYLIISSKKTFVEKPHPPLGVTKPPK